MSEHERYSTDHGDEKQSGRPSALGLLSLGIAMFSLFIAGVSAFFTYRTRVDSLHHVIVEDLYETFEEWNAHTLANPFLLHLLASPESYGRVSSMVEEGVGQLTDARAVELMLAERAMADVVFDAYDELLVDLESAEASGDEFLIRAIEVAMEDFEGQLLLNPRLRHLWHELDEDQRRHEVHARYFERVESRAVEDDSPDALGPIHRARSRALEVTDAEPGP